MGLVIAGIDEAGYGPLLGPLCVGMSVLRLEEWEPGAPAPDLWRLLKRAVCAKPVKSRGRIAIADSKKLKLANDSTARHPLHHLERGVLAFGHALRGLPADDAALFEGLGARLDGSEWYGGQGAPLPVAHDAATIAIDANVLCAALEKAGVRVEALACGVVCENEFNRIVKETHSKAEADAAAIGVHLRTLRERFFESGDHVRVVCDRLGGRLSYGMMLERELPGVSVRVLEQSPERCRYEIEEGRIGFHFMPEAESKHLTVALASMTAKYVRELAMARFNRYWATRMPQLKATAGYNTDARRWLADTACTITEREREALVRIA
jgi:hypothetical protein